MKLVCKKFVGHKFALPKGRVEVDADGMIEVPEEAVSVFKDMGFEELPKKENPKKEEKKVEQKVEVKEEKKEELKFSRNK